LSPEHDKQIHPRSQNGAFFVVFVNEMKMSDCDNVFDFICQTFNKRSKEVETPNQFEAMLVWYVAERIASEVRK
jgi:hypothetical protein